MNWKILYTTCSRKATAKRAPTAANNDHNDSQKRASLIVFSQITNSRWKGQASIRMISEARKVIHVLTIVFDSTK